MMKDFKTNKPKACKELKENIQDDNVFMKASNLQALLQAIPKDAGEGCFKLKQFMIQGQVASGLNLGSLKVYDEVQKDLGNH
jgi:hypothetical protein